MTTGEGVALVAGALLLGGLTYVGATKFAAGSSAEADAAKAALAAERERQLAQQVHAQSEVARQAQLALERTQSAASAARPNAGGVIAAVLPGVINLGAQWLSRQ
jgi:hypothetical protein